MGEHGGWGRVGRWGGVTSFVLLSRTETSPPKCSAPSKPVPSCKTQGPIAAHGAGTKAGLAMNWHPRPLPSHSRPLHTCERCPVGASSSSSSPGVQPPQLPTPATRPLPRGPPTPSVPGPTRLSFMSCVDGIGGFVSFELESLQRGGNFSLALPVAT